MNDKTNLTRVPDARSVVVSKQHHVMSAAGTFDGFEKGTVPVEGIAKSYCPDPAEVKDGDAPVASGSDWFHIAGLAAVAEGHISEEGLKNVMRVLYPGVPCE